jgi:nucleotide-binding universal stress UspA family protein
MIEFRRILVPIDGSPYTDKAIEYAKAIAKNHGAHIVLLHVIVSQHMPVSYEHPYAGGLSAIENQMKVAWQKGSKRLLEEKKEALAEFGNKVEIAVLEGDPASEIIDFAEKNQFDLIIMGSKGMGSGTLKRFLVGSVTEKVIHQVITPVLVVR